MKVLKLSKGPISGRKRDISLIHLDKAAVTSTLSIPRLQLSAVAFSSDGSGLAVSSLSGHILVGKVDRTENNEQLPRFSLIERHCAGKCIATGGLDSFVHTFALEKSLTVDDLSGHRGGVNCVQFMSNEHLLFSTSSRRRVLLWDVRSVWSTAAHGAAVVAVNFESKGNHLVTVGEDGCVGIWPYSSSDS
ncbi:WD repeat containing protein 51A [Echinococcus multilocularis]|uniref:WD repeat containing protein 51A n=1 Tax=Echinococcus multilocularis TaxID=6211 RepID=A0A068YC53_ECHMU|nr:WD repeat containing protein 51A [Echinococcus multilocularis]